VTPEIPWLTIGISAGSGILAIIIITVIVVIVVVTCRRRPDKPTEERTAYNNNCAEPIELDDADRYYSYIGLPAAEAYNRVNEYCRPLPAAPNDNSNNKEYSALSSSEPEPSSNNNSPYYLTLKSDDEC